MPLYIKDETTAQQVARRARLHGVTKQDAVKLAVLAESDRVEQAQPPRKRFAALRTEHLLPPPTGEAADKAFFDDLSSDLSPFSLMHRH